MKRQDLTWHDRIGCIVFSVHWNWIETDVNGTKNETFVPPKKSGTRTCFWSFVCAKDTNTLFIIILISCWCKRHEYPCVVIDLQAFVDRILDNLPLVVPMTRLEKDSPVIYQHGYFVGRKVQYAGVRPFFFIIIIYYLFIYQVLYIACLGNWKEKKKKEWNFVKSLDVMGILSRSFCIK